MKERTGPESASYDQKRIDQLIKVNGSITTGKKIPILLDMSNKLKYNNSQNRKKNPEVFVVFISGGKSAGGGQSCTGAGAICC